VKFQLLKTDRYSNYMKVDTKKIKKELKSILNVFWQRLFLVLLLFILIDFLIAGLFFYVYYVKAQEKEPVAPLLLNVNQVLLEGVFSKWDEKEVEFQKAISREFPNLFREIAPPVPPIEATSTPEATSLEEVSGE